MKQRHRVISGSFIIFQKGDTYFFIKRKGSGFMDGRWGLVSGHLEPDETLSECAVREVREESGLEIQKSDLRHVHVCCVHTEYDGVKIQAVHNYFKVLQWKGDPISAEGPEKSDGYEWINPYKKDCELFVPAEKHVFDAIRRGDSYSEFDYGKYFENKHY